MRQILLGVIIISILTSCSEKENLTLDQEIQKLGDPTQIFTITSDKTETIEAKNGTRLIIRPNAFVFKDGQNAKGLIQIELKEVFDKSDMIINGLGTLSDSRLLESFGMIYLSATSEGKELKLKENSSIAVSIPNKRKGDAGELFYGVQTDSVVNWKYAGTTNDTTEVIETYTQLPDSLSIKRTTYKFVDGEKQFVSDSTYKVRGQWDIAEGGGKFEIPISYEFEIKNLGWINCDRFIEIVDKVDLEIELKTSNRAVGYLVFADINSVMWLTFNEKGIAIVENLPSDYSADLIVIDKIDKTYMWTKQNLKIGAQSKVTLETRKINKEELKTELNSLDR
jgi:hypothetical protein